VNRNTNLIVHKRVAMCVNWGSYIVVRYLKILIPVGTAINIVVSVNCARATPSISTVNMWCGHNTSPSNPIAIMAKIVHVYKLLYISLYYNV
jgi:hypothetical protein